MKIILKKEVTNLGEAGDVVEVKAGYAQNYLIPQGFATVATPSAVKQLEETKRQRAHKEAKLVADAEALAAKIEAATAKVAVKVSEPRSRKPSRLSVSRLIRRTSPSPRTSRPLESTREPSRSTRLSRPLSSSSSRLRPKTSNESDKATPIRVSLFF